MKRTLTLLYAKRYENYFLIKKTVFDLESPCLEMYPRKLIITGAVLVTGTLSLQHGLNSETSEPRKEVKKLKWFII